jgi:protein-tyrosine phosphatase
MPTPTLFPIPIPAPPPARLSTMPRPRGDDWLDDEMAALRRAGVDILVCLLTEAERHELGLADEVAAAARAGVECRLLPVVDFGVPDRAEAEPVLSDLAAALAAGRHVAVHCRGGIGRSSVIAGALLVRLGVPVADVWPLISAARGRPVPETQEQRDWITTGP